MKQFLSAVCFCLLASISTSSFAINHTSGNAQLEGNYSFQKVTDADNDDVVTVEDNSTDDEGDSNGDTSSDNGDNIED